MLTSKPLNQGNIVFYIFILYHGNQNKIRRPGFCLRFADDFELSWDDWQPAQLQRGCHFGPDTGGGMGAGGDATTPPIMNAMVVPQGTYEICTRTSRQQKLGQGTDQIKWVMNINWVMKGLG